MIRPAGPRPLLAACLALGGLAFGGLAFDGLAGAGPAAAQGVPPFTGFSALPSFAWPPPAGEEDGRWAGSYARISAGYEAVSSRHFGSSAGPTVGFEAGRMWQEGRFVYGIVGGLDALTALQGGSPGFGRLAYARDFAGAVQVKVGTLLAPDVLLYAKAGAAAVHGTLRLGATPVSPPASRDGVAVRPDARVGVEWAVTDRLSVAVEAGMTGGGYR